MKVADNLASLSRDSRLLHQLLEHLVADLFLSVFRQRTPALILLILHLLIQHLLVLLLHPLLILLLLDLVPTNQLHAARSQTRVDVCNDPATR